MLAKTLACEYDVRGGFATVTERGSHSGRFLCSLVLTRMKETQFFELAALEQQQRSAALKAYTEFLRVPAMSAGVYVLPGGGSDLQSPHHEDELYYVVSGRGRLRAGAEDRVVRSGSLIFVAAGVQHRFYEIEEQLTVLVFFAPAQS